MSLERIQRRLVDLYDLRVESEVSDFLCEGHRVPGTNGEQRGEVLVIVEGETEAQLGLYLAPHVIDQLARTDEARWTTDALGAYCLALEGVSHFLYIMFRAAHAAVPVSQIELELQAEVDKYATGLLDGFGAGLVRERVAASQALRATLFEDATYLDAPGTEAGDRYRTATRLAAQYAAWLEGAFVAPGDATGLVRELRRFYRRGAADKLAGPGRR